MDSGYYAACTALVARSQALDLIAHNMANVSTSGYRAQHNIFASVLAASNRSLSPLNEAVNDYGVWGGSQLDMAQGNLEKTGNDLDLGIEGKGFFVVKTQAGQVYTRSGNFHVSPQQLLVTAEGDPVMGTNGPVQIVGGPVAISADGTISVNGAVSGRLKIVEFKAGVALDPAGKTYYSGSAASEIPAKETRIQQGTLEASNVNPLASAVELIAVQRYAELAQRALTLFHSDLNQIAAQDLPRVPGT